MSGASDAPSGSGNGALVAVLLEIDRHIAADGWDQPPRLFALVPSAELSAAEPGLADRLGVGDAGGRPADALSAVEQDEFSAAGTTGHPGHPGHPAHPGHDLSGELAQISWPAAVTGCALSLVRTFLPSTAEADIPEDPEAAVGYVNGHPERQEIRVVVGVDRAGHRHGLARLASQPDELLAAEDLIPGLASLLAHTLT